MPVVREPKPLPSPLDYVPAQSTAHRVKSGDSWWSLSELPQVKASNLSALDLCYFNFKTRRPGEINWYLHKKVGCRTSTHDGKNYKFSSEDAPGIVYLPLLGPKLPVHEYPTPSPSQRLNAWIGFGAKAGTQFVVVGIETLAGYVASLDDVGKGMAIGASINRLGPGVGATGGACLIYITAVKSPGEINGLQQGGWDFNLSLGGNWGKMAKGVGPLRKAKPIIDKLLQLGARTPDGLKRALKANPDKWIELIKTARTLKDTLGIDPNGDPNVLVVDLPVGGGVEASVYYGLSNFNALWDFTE